MSLGSSSMELGSALKDLRVLWDETKTVWNDPVREYFEQNHWIPLEKRVLAGLHAMDQLAPILDKIRQECGEESYRI
jgi:hypothetical protein